MSEHTKEPWNHSGDEVKTADGNLIAVTLLGTSLIENQDNARRIVACVNACAGISNEQIENWKITDGTILDVIKRQTRYVNQLEHQRDKLLEALKEAEDYICTLPVPTKSASYMLLKIGSLVDEIEATK